MTAPYRRTDSVDVLGNHERRVSILEAIKPAVTVPPGLKWAVAGYGGEYQEIVSGRIRWHANILETNDNVLFILDTIANDPVKAGVNQWASWVKVLDPGYYMVSYTAFVVAAEFTTETKIEPVNASTGGADNTMLNALPYGQFQTNFGIANQRITASELDHDQFNTVMGFWWDPTMLGMSLYDPLRLAWRIVTGDGDGNFRSLGGLMQIIQIATFDTGTYDVHDLS